MNWFSSKQTLHMGASLTSYPGKHGTEALTLPSTKPVQPQKVAFGHLFVTFKMKSSSQAITSQVCKPQASVLGWGKGGHCHMPTNCCMVAAQWWQQQRGTCRQAASNTNYRGDWECWSDLAALRSTLSHSEFSHYSLEKEKKIKIPSLLKKGSG